MISRPRAATTLTLVLTPLLFAGCAAPQQVSNKPEEHFNPAISDHQKAVLTAHKQQSGDLPTQ